MLEPLTEAQRQLYDWLAEYIHLHQHSPSIRQMMAAMNLKSPAPVQSRLEHLRNKGYIVWTEGQARTIRLLHPEPKGVPILAGEPCRRRAPATSRKASSMPSCSTSGVKSSKMRITRSEYSLYRPMCGSNTTAAGQRRRASAMGMAELTP